MHSRGRLCHLAQGGCATGRATPWSLVHYCSIQTLRTTPMTTPCIVMLPGLTWMGLKAGLAG